MRIIKMIVDRYYLPPHMELLLPRLAFLTAVESILRTIPEEEKWHALNSVKESIDALAALYSWKYIKAGAGLSPEQERQELAKLEEQLRKLGLLW